MKNLLIPLAGWKPGKVFNDKKRLENNIPDVVWDNTDIFETGTLTYAYIATKVGEYLPTVGAGKSTTNKFKAYVKLYGLALYLNNIVEIKANTFVFENRWIPTITPENGGFIILGRMGTIEVRRQMGFESYGIVFKNEEDAEMAIELLGSVINDMLQ